MKFRGGVKIVAYFANYQGSVFSMIFVCCSTVLCVVVDMNKCMYNIQFIETTITECWHIMLPINEHLIDLHNLLLPLYGDIGLTE